MREFIKGVDVSMLKELEEHGAVYCLEGIKEDIFEILKSCGVNLVRLRLWNDPYSESGKAYGGGTNDFETTVGLAKRIIKSGLEFMLDFHYSDFWADPSKQIKPKAWGALIGKQLGDAVYRYTADIMQRLRREGIRPGIVQIGNEITNGFLWPDGRAEQPETMAGLLAEGIRAVRETDSAARILLHLDFGTDNAMYRKWFERVAPYRLDFDIVGMSYYPYWNGSLEKLLYNMNDISGTLEKDVLVAETAIGYTTDPLGCSGLAYTEKEEVDAGYPATPEGQELFLKDLYDTVRKVDNGRGVGALYWEPDWLPIPECAWAKIEGCEYMKERVEPGNSWANQALFDAGGNANQALVHLKCL